MLTQNEYHSRNLRSLEWLKQHMRTHTLCRQRNQKHKNEE